MDRGIDTKKSEAFRILMHAFREFYFKYGKKIEPPTDIRKREFACRYFGPNGEPNGMVRHLTFQNGGEILATALREVPSDLYCSNGYYRFPTYPMQEKGWLGADLIFDIDTKDLRLPCQSDHSYIICETCSHATKGEKKQGLSRCPSCDSQNMVFESIPCKSCIDSAKKEVRRLILFLIEDFGVEEKDISIYFSGNDGFHIHVTDPDFLNLDAHARSDITAYILGKGLLPETIGVYKRGIRHGPKRRFKNESGDMNNFVVKFPKSGLKYGWRKRLSQQFTMKDRVESKLKNLVQQRGGYYGFKVDLERRGRELGVNIDPQVTMDIHRVFRMPGSLNSKSGLTKMRCGNLNSFNPMDDACLLSDDKTKVKVKTPVRFTLKSQRFRIDENEMSLPAYAAIYLVCKKLAILI